MATPLYSDWAPGAESQPLVKRSQYLADALKSLEAQSQAPRSRGELGSRLLADAVLQYAGQKNDTDLRAAQRADVASESNSVLASLGGVPQAAPAAAPQALAAAIAPPTQATPPAPVAVQSSPLPPADPNRSNGTAPLGIRQNNPGNIRDTPTPWQGAVGAQGGFEQFDTPENGIRALARNLQTYGQKGINTPEGIVNRWAPPTENNSPAYVADLSRQTGFAPGAPLDMQNPDVLAKLAGGIITHENGQNPYSPQQIQQGVMSAMGQATQPLAQQSPAVSASPGPAVGEPSAAAPSSAGGGPPRGGPTPQELQLIQQAYQSGDPNKVAFARQLAQSIQLRMSKPPEYKVQVTRAGQVVRTDPDTGQVIVTDVPNFRQQLSNNMGYGPDGRAHQIPGTETHNMSAEQLGIPAPAGTMFSVDPSGKATQLYTPPSGFQVRGQGGLEPQRGGPADPASGSNIVKNEGDLRDEYSKATKEFQDSRIGYSKVLSAAHDNTGASDIALIFGFMKTLDPNSTVREGEFSTAQNSGSIPQTVMNAYNKALKGERLQPQQRLEFARTAEQQFKSYADRAQALNQRYTGMAQSYGFDPSRIVSPVSIPQALAGGQQQPTMPNLQNMTPQQKAQLRAAAMQEIERRKAGGK